jgi:hypothetical protein
MNGKEQKKLGFCRKETEIRVFKHARFRKESKISQIQNRDPKLWISQINPKLGLGRNQRLTERLVQVLSVWKGDDCERDLGFKETHTDQM